MAFTVLDDIGETVGWRGDDSAIWIAEPGGEEAPEVVVAVEDMGCVAIECGGGTVANRDKLTT